MANTVVPWDRRPEYLAFTDWTPIPGVTTYFGPRGGTGTNRTSFHPAQAFLSEHNMSDIMYQLHPCEEWKRFQKSPLPRPKTNPDGSLVYEQWTRPGQERQPLLDFKLLPDKISSEEGWWYYEFVRRMDPRIRQRDIIMREEASAERSRMTDQRYINLHLNTPGYRTYRPAWKMISWQVKTQDQNEKKEFVLDRLTDAQKNANTTRGSTPGLIDPALGEIAGNRIALPNLVQKKQGPRRPRANANNPAATQPVQPVKPAQAPQAPQAPQATQVAQVTQATQASQTPQASDDNQNQRQPQPSHASSYNDATTPLPVDSTTIGVSFQDPANMAAIQRQNDLRGHTEAQARDAAAMPPPPHPSLPRNGQLFPAQVSSSRPDRQSPTNRLQDSGVIQANTMGVKDSGITNDYGPEPEYPFMKDEEIATMSARSDKAMAEISRICEPFLETDSSIQGAPSMDLSPALIEELGLGLLFAQRAKGQLPENWTEGTTPTPAQTMQAGSVAQQTPAMLSGKQGTKQKEYDGGDEHFQHVQLDVEKREPRPRKQVKSVHHARAPSNHRAPHHDAACNSKQQHHLASSSGDPRVGNSRGTAFGGRALQVAAPPAQPQWFASVEDVDPYNLYTDDNLNEEHNGFMVSQYSDQTIDPSLLQQGPRTHLGTTFPGLRPFAHSPYRHAPAPEARLPDSESWVLPQSDAVETSGYDDRQSGPTMRHSPPMSSPVPNEQPFDTQVTATRPRSRGDRGSSRQPSRRTGNNHRYHPYAN